ncbi:MAG: AmmeMemoRadiSam system radical SAM enzyme [Planctomycetota bacterium]|jgi:pyruvate formate lyase activating enzyme
MAEVGKRKPSAAGAWLTAAALLAALALAAGIVVGSFAGPEGGGSSPAAESAPPEAAPESGPEPEPELPAPPPKISSPERPLSREKAEAAGLKPREASWWEPLSGGAVRCTLCPRRCTLPPGGRGFCRVRSNYGGKMFTLVYGSPVAANSMDPIEKKPLYHVLPGSRVTSVATAGCDLGCIFCQNWEISQAYPEETPPRPLSPLELVRRAQRAGSAAVAYTYTEPTVFYEYMLDTARLARKAGLRNLWVTCGYIEEKPLRELAEVIDAANVDLKGFTDEFYRKYCKAERAPVMRTIRLLPKLGVHVEVTNLVIPGANDDEKSVRAMCRWIVKEVGPETPLHFSRYRPDYKMRRPGPTPLATLVRLREVAREEGLKHVYIGNIAAPDGGTTRCAKCGGVLVERAYGYVIRTNRLEPGGACPDCGAKALGIWK